MAATSHHPGHPSAASTIAGTVVIATVSATEDDLTGKVSYAITAGNALRACTIDPGTGEITVSDS